MTVAKDVQMVPLSTLMMRPEKAFLPGNLVLLVRHWSLHMPVGYILIRMLVLDRERVLLHLGGNTFKCN